MTAPKLKPTGFWIFLLFLLPSVCGLAGCQRRLATTQSAASQGPFIPPAPAANPTSTAIAEPPTPRTAQPEVPGRASETPIPILTDPSLPRSQYEISADFDYTAHQLVVFENLIYVNRSAASLDNLTLIVEPNRRQGVFQLRELSWASGTAVEGYQLDMNRLDIPLPQPLPPWNSVSLNFAFALNLPAGPGTLGYTLRQANLGDWYPFAPLYQDGTGWLIHEPGEAGIGEYLTYDIADYRIEIQLIAPPSGLVLAASAPGQQDGNWHRYQVEAARNFSWSASPDYEILEDNTGFVSVYTYVFPEHHGAGEAATAASADALKLYAELFGPLSHKSLSVVEAEFPDGMEYDGLYFLGQGYFETYYGGPQNFLTTLAAHETAHQWWYGLVANDQAFEPWLDEALATYSERLFYERYYPELVDWWWEFRVDLYGPEGWVDASIYDFDGFRPYVNAVYLRGARFLEELRGRVGEEAFFSTLQALITRSSYNQVTTADFFELLESNSPVDLASLRQEYFRKP